MHSQRTLGQNNHQSKTKQQDFSNSNETELTSSTAPVLIVGTPVVGEPFVRAGALSSQALFAHLADREADGRPCRPLSLAGNRREFSRDVGRASSRRI
jgi:hypothetical protein